MTNITIVFVFVIKYFYDTVVGFLISLYISRIAEVVIYNRRKQKHFSKCLNFIWQTTSAALDLGTFRIRLWFLCVCDRSVNKFHILLVSNTKSQSEESLLVKDQETWFSCVKKKKRTDQGQWREARQWYTVQRWSDNEARVKRLKWMCMNYIHVRPTGRRLPHPPLMEQTLIDGNRVWKELNLMWYIWWLANLKARTIVRNEWSEWILFGGDEWQKEGDDERKGRNMKFHSFLLPWDEKANLKREKERHVSLSFV